MVLEKIRKLRKCVLPHDKMADIPTVLLQEDRESFIAEFGIEYQTEAENEWNNHVTANEELERNHRSNKTKEYSPRRTPYFLSVEQVATRWNVSTRTVWRMVRDRRLPSTQIGSLRRIREEDLEKIENFEMISV